MFKYFFNRVASMGLIMLFVTSVTFFIVRLLPGDPVFLLVGDHPTEEQIEKAKNDFNLNESIYKQYVGFLKKTMFLDLGVSLRTKQPVLTELTKRFSATFELVLFSMFIAILFGFPVGLISALKQKKRIDYFFRSFGYLGLSIPVFWLGMILQIIFFGILYWLPLQGRYSGMVFQDSPLIYNSGFILIDSFFSGEWTSFIDALRHITLPAFTMAFGVFGIVVRTTRSVTIDTMSAPFFRTFKFYGLKNSEIIKKSGYKNTLVPVSTVVGLSFGLMLGGTFLVESIFDWPGVGQFSVLSILTRDFPAIVGVTILYSFIYVIINFFIDMFYVIVDPRIRD